VNPLRIIQEIKDKPRVAGADTVVEDTCSQHLAELSVTLHARKLRWLRFAAVQASAWRPSISWLRSRFRTISSKIVV
jgi:hypothetical protein